MNLLPGQGLGFSASKEIAFGLGAVTVTEIPITPDDPYYSGGGGFSSATVYDNAYSKPNDDNEIVEILHILLQVIE